MINVLYGFLAGFIFFPIFARFIYPLLLEYLSKIVESEKDRVAPSDT